MHNNLQPRPSHHNAMHQSGFYAPTLVSRSKLQNINCIIEPTASMGGIYLGDIICTLKPQILRDNQIQAVLSCLADRVNLSVGMMHHKILPLKDTLDYPISYYFEQATQWIEQRRKEGLNVLVHCHAGVSRSATMVIAYFIRCKQWSPVDALNHVRSRRQRAKPNENFWNQLLSFHQHLIKSSSPIVGQNSRKSEKEIVTVESKQNIDQQKRVTGPLPEPLKTEQRQQMLSRDRQITSRDNLTKPIEHQQKSVLRKRRPIFDSPIDNSRPANRQQILSCEPFSQQQNSSQLKKNTYSIVYPSQGQPSQLSQRRPQQFQQNRSGIEYRVMSHQPPRMMNPQPIRYITPAHNIKVNYHNSSQPYVSPFELQGQLRNN